METPLACCPATGPQDLRAALLNDWQRDFPLLPRPFHLIARRYGLGPEPVLQSFAQLLAEGAVSRIGGVFGVGAGGAGLLCAMAVAPAALAHVAERVSREPQVNHNYEREHRLNLWFVVTATDPAGAAAVVQRIAAETGRQVLCLPMRRAFRIDLGFDLCGRANPQSQHAAAARPVLAEHRPLAARLELGLPIEQRPYAALGRDCALGEDAVLRVLAQWQHDRTLRRFGVIVRHHELGWSHNAMTVFGVADEQLEFFGQRLAAQPGVTLCYRREPAPGWPFNLYCMIHGRSRPAVERSVAAAARGAGLDRFPRQVLFSRRRFKQTGSRYFAQAPS